MKYKTAYRAAIRSELKSVLLKFLVLFPEPESELEAIMDEIEATLGEQKPQPPTLRLVPSYNGDMHSPGVTSPH